MSRIQEILRKAEREGGVHRTRAVGADTPSAPHASAIAPAIPRSAPRPEPEAVPVAVDTRPWRAATPESVTTTRRATATLDPRLVAALAPQSIAAEQYRSLRTRLRQSENGRSLRSILITSPATGDGKSLTAANLALTMAQEFQQRVLLVDADLRRPSLHALFGLQEMPGLADVLLGGVSLEDALVAIEDHRLTVLPSGVSPTHPAELLGAASMRRTLDSLRTSFDRIILDMPPVEPLADVHILAPVIDGVLMIVRAGLTPKPAIDRALAGLDPARVLGLVLNEAGPAGGREGYYGGYGSIAG
jgi:protein-tyrosine kinase